MIEDFVAKDGKTYQIEFDADFGDPIRIFVLKNGAKLGSIELEYCDDNNVYHLMVLSLDQCKKLGLGQRCLELFKDKMNATITAADLYGPKLQDGSHLIGDGPGFVSAMRRKGLIAKNYDPDESNDAA